MNMDKGGQKLHQTKKKYSNKGHPPNRKLPRYKKNPCRRRDIITKTSSINTSSLSKQQQAMIQFLQDHIFSMPDQSQAKTKSDDFHFHRGSNSDLTLLLFDYSIMSKIAFKEMLIRTAGNTNINSFVESLNNEETWTYTRQLTQLINQLNYLKLQDEQWAHYYQLGMKEGIWTGRVSKRMARDNSMCHSYGRSKHIVEQRCRKFQQQLQHMTGDIDKHMTTKTAPEWNSAMVINIIADLVDKNNYPIRVELERRREMLRFDAEDHRCIQAFYDLGPTQTEIQAAKFIWKATHDEQALRYEIEMFKHWLQFKSSNSITSRPIPNIPFLKIKHILTRLILDQKQSTTTIQISIEESDSTTPESSSCDLIRRMMSIAEERNESSARNATIKTTRLIETTQTTNPSRCTHHIINAITSRQTTMIQRARYQLQQMQRLAFESPTMTTKT